MCELIIVTFSGVLKCYLSILLGHFDRLLLAMSATKSQEKQAYKTKRGTHAYGEHKGKRKYLYK